MFLQGLPDPRRWSGERGLNAAMVAHQSQLPPPIGLKMDAREIYGEELGVPGKTSLEGFVDDQGDACIVKDAPELQPHFGSEQPRDPMPRSWGSASGIAGARGQAQGQSRAAKVVGRAPLGPLRVLHESVARQGTALQMPADSDEFDVVDEVYDELDRFEFQHLPGFTSGY